MALQCTHPAEGHWAVFMIYGTQDIYTESGNYMLSPPAAVSPPCSITKADRAPAGRDALTKRIEALCRHFQGSLYVQVCR
jgi:hypothetical protein